MTTLRQVSKRITAIRDEAICKAVLSGQLSVKAVAVKYSLEPSTIYVILYRAKKETERKSK